MNGQLRLFHRSGETSRPRQGRPHQLKRTEQLGTSAISSPGNESDCSFAYTVFLSRSTVTSRNATNVLRRLLGGDRAALPHAPDRKQVCPVGKGMAENLEGKSSHHALVLEGTRTGQRIANPENRLPATAAGLNGARSTPRRSRELGQTCVPWHLRRPPGSLRPGQISGGRGQASTYGPCNRSDLADHAARA